MRTNFDRAFDLLMEMEGYESNDKRDPGGYTKWGIAEHFHPEVKFSSLTREDAKDFYLTEYWTMLGCDEKPFPFDIALFIQGVNLGSRAIRYMEQSDTILDFLMLCLEHYTTRPKSRRDAFLAGWCNRLIKLWRNTK